MLELGVDVVSMFDLHTPSTSSPLCKNKGIRTPNERAIFCIAYAKADAGIEQSTFLCLRWHIHTTLLSSGYL